MDVMLQEYDVLRNEIINNSSMITQVFVISITATVGIIGYGLKQENKLNT